MSSPTKPELPNPWGAATLEETKKLEPLEQIISGTSPLVEDLAHDKEGREKYLEMLQASIEQARSVRLTPAPKPRPAETTGGKELILQIDDDRGTLDLVGEILSSAGYNVVMAQSGFEGIDEFRKRPFDFNLVLTDLTMPFMDGEETFARLREIRPDVPVILATGFIQEERLTHLRSIGLAGFLRKPVAPDELVMAIRSTLESVKYSGGSLSSGGVSITI